MIRTAHLFRSLGRELIVLLRGLSDDQWLLPTSAPLWSVRDVAAHLLDVDLRRLSLRRDGHGMSGPSDPNDLVSYLNALNATWVDAARRLSTRVITDLLDTSTQQVATLMELEDPYADAPYPVAWAGQDASPLWLDIGREYTERWHHQDQIREATGASPLAAAEWLRPVIDISVLALPHAYAAVDAPAHTRIVLSIRGPGGGDWTLERNGTWHVLEGATPVSDCHVCMDDLDFARLLLHRLPTDVARGRMDVTGSAALAEPLLRTRAVMVKADQ